MRELPKFVIERLKVSTPPALHPDADLLAAFAEHSLPASERDVVLEHLARCGDCRNIVALALPATEALEPAGAVVGLRSRWRWPVLRGAAVAAGIIAVAAIGIFQYQHRTPANVIVARTAERDEVTAPPASDETKTAAPRSESVPQLSDLRHDAVAPTRSAVAAAKRPPGATDAFGWRTKSSGVAAGSAGAIGSASASGAGQGQGTKMAMAQPPRDLAFASSAQPPPQQTMKQMPTPSPARSNATPPSSQVIEVQSQAETVTVEAQAPTQYAQNADVQAPVESADRVRRAKPPSASSAAPAVGGLTRAQNQIDLPQAYPTPMPHWTISATGGLQRSLDGGKTWQDVNVNAQPRAYGGSMQAAIVSENRVAKAKATDVAREKDDVADKKKEAAKAETAPLFRAVVAIGNEVWAGGSGGLLYHSADAGTLWTSVTPSAQGVMLSGDIIRIEFSDPLHGKVTTSSSETWTTADGGQSWRKQ